jgi:CRP-like cAMP-binding protein
MAAKAQALCIDRHWQGRSRCRVCAVRSAMPFAGLDVAELDAVLQPIDHFAAPAGTRLLDAGASSATVFTIRRGFVKLHDVTPEGRPRIVRLLRPGDVVGLEALAGGAHAHAADAITEIDACRIPTALLHELEARQPALHEALLQRWAAALRQADAFIIELSSGPATSRIARLLDLLVELADGQPPPRLSRQDIAAACDLTPETASRIASEWIAQGWLVEELHSFHVDREALGRFLAA